MRTLGQMLDESKSTVRSHVANARTKVSHIVAGPAIRHPTKNLGVAATVHNVRSKVASMIKPATLADEIVVRSRSGERMVAPPSSENFEQIGYRRKN